MTRATKSPPASNSSVGSKVRHALVVGGTGMLRGVVRWLAEEGWTVSVVARGRQRLVALEEEACPLAGSVRPIRVDYRNDKALRTALESANERFGPMELAVCWIHSTAPRALGIIAAVLANQPTRPRLFGVWGSVSTDPSVPDPDDARLSSASTGLAYRRVILGFEADGCGSRWLTDSEIASGVIDAITGDAPSTVVGTVRDVL